MTSNKFSFYNSEIKEGFLDSLSSDSTKEFAASTFKKLKELEDEMKKDLYEMSFQEIDSAMKTYTNAKESTKIAKLSILERYIDWTIEQGLADHSFNSITTIGNKKEWAAKL